MRKIVSKHTEAKKTRRNQIIGGLVLVGLMMFSVLGYAFRGGGDEDSSAVKYNGFEFVFQNGYWFTVVGNQQFAFSNNPSTTERIDFNGKNAGEYSGKALYLNSESADAGAEIYNNLGSIALRVQLACLDTACDDISPIKTCEDNFIKIEKNDVAEISVQNNCVFIRGPEENLTQIADEFLFKTLGIVG